MKVPLTRWTTAEERFRIGKLGFVKIDVEGSEVFVLRELGDRLRKDRPVVAVEVLPTHDPPIADRLGRQKEIERIVQQNDMVIHRVHKELKGVRLERLSEFGIHSDLAWIDHLLVPNEREAEVMKAFEH